MAIRTRDEIMAQVDAMTAENNSENATAFIEDVADTLAEYERRIQESGDWEQRYQQNDAQWRQRYHDRFFGRGAEQDPADDIVPGTEIPSFESLFK